MLPQVVCGPLWNRRQRRAVRPGAALRRHPQCRYADTRPTLSCAAALLPPAHRRNLSRTGSLTRLKWGEREEPVIVTWKVEPLPSPFRCRYHFTHTLRDNEVERVIMTPKR